MGHGQIDLTQIFQCSLYLRLWRLRVDALFCAPLAPNPANVIFLVNIAV